MEAVPGQFAQEQLRNMHMMRKPITSLLFTLVLVVGGLHAQHFGVRGGLNWTDASFETINSDVVTGEQVNLMIGLFVDIPIGQSILSVQPELNYLERGYTFDGINGDIEFARSTACVDLGGLIRLNIGKQEGTSFYIGTGPFFNYAISGTFREGDNERDLDFDAELLNRSELSLVAAAGVNFGSFFIEARQIVSLSNQAADDERDISQSSTGVNIGFRTPLF